MATAKNTNSNPLELDYSKNFVLLDVDKTLINGNLYNTVLIDMLRNNSDNNFFLFTRYSGQTLDSLKNSLILSENKDVFNNAKKSLRSSVVTYLKKNTIENLSGTLPKIIPINIKGVITPYDAVFNSECPIPGDYYKKNYQEIEEKFENLNFSDKAIIAEGLEIDLKIKELIEKEKQEETEKKKRNGEITKYDDFDITLKINMFRKLVKYILDNKPETEKKKPTFIFFDDEAQQLFSVGLVGLAMYKQINLFIQNPFQKKTQTQGFITKESYQFDNPINDFNIVQFIGQNNKKYNNNNNFKKKPTFNDPFDFYNSFQKIDQDILDKFCLYFLEEQMRNIILNNNSNGINLKNDELNLICTYNTNKLNLKFIFFFLIIRLNQDFKTFSITFNEKDYGNFNSKYNGQKITDPYKLTAPEINNTVNSSNTTISNNQAELNRVAAAASVNPAAAAPVNPSVNPAAAAPAELEISNNTIKEQLKQILFLNLLNVETFKIYINQNKLKLFNLNQINFMKNKFQFEEFSDKEKKKIENRETEISQENTEVANSFNNKTDLSALTDEQIVQISPDKISQLTSQQIKDLTKWSLENKYDFLEAEKGDIKLHLLKKEQIQAIKTEYILEFLLKVDKVDFVTLKFWEKLTDEQNKFLDTNHLMYILNYWYIDVGDKKKLLQSLTQKQLNDLQEINININIPSLINKKITESAKKKIDNEIKNYIKRLKQLPAVASATPNTATGNTTTSAATAKAATPAATTSAVIEVSKQAGTKDTYIATIKKGFNNMKGGRKKLKNRKSKQTKKSKK